MNTENYDISRNLFMSNKEGLFTQSLKSLEIQLKTLFYDSGNENAITFLDSLSNLSIAEQEIVLNIFKAVVDKLVSGEKRLLSEKDLQQKKIEDDLYQEIVKGMNAAAAIPNLDGKRLEVLQGGKNCQKNKVLIDFKQARKDKKTVVKPVLN